MIIHDVLKAGIKQPIVDTKSPAKRATWLTITRHLLQVMRTCYVVVLSYLDARSEPWCFQEDFLTACCLLVLVLLLVNYIAHLGAYEGL